MQTSLILFMFTYVVVSVFSLQHNCKELPGVHPVVPNGGLEFPMWLTLVDKSGVICAIVFSGNKIEGPWLASRLVSASNAYTANSLSGPTFAISSGNLWYATQPGGSIWGLADSANIQSSQAFDRDYSKFGSRNDPLVGKRIGGMTTFGGGLALYDKNHEKIGAIGVSGDTSCADHNIAWRVRQALQLDYNTKGGIVSGVARGTDAIIYDVKPLSSGIQSSPSGWGHPWCTDSSDNIAYSIHAAYPN